MQNSYFAKKRDLNPLPHGNVAADIAKMFANFLQKSVFAKTFLQTFLQWWPLLPQWVPGSNPAF
jgi:hypothetical protein